MTTPGFRPTHVVPQDGLPAWESPDPSRPTVPLDALLPVELVDRLGDWGRIVCANGWSAWVDGRLLIAVPQVPPAATRPLARTADPRPLLARVEQALTDYRQAAEDLASGQLEAENFRARTQGSRIGVVVDGESLWLYDGEHERWVYCDGTRLSTFAAERTPSTARRESAHQPRAEQEPSRDRAQSRDRGTERDRGPEQDRGPGRDRSQERDRSQGPSTARERQAEPTRIVREPAPGGPPSGPPGGHEPTRLVTFGGDDGDEGDDGSED
ncbi:hypothetical protein [Streptomyces sp. NBC_00151]|uniref:hypothetical protein n=1 Tax=Streptomyces sp. NBC_00151 TaxID=2975669 RepID=UPI002DD94257|nr:hypothetical protein [Streptomyces sp. NBC_00151]WRZ43756.1 hypothetical protein OG915_40360 [Streptomyces sp. NBC_00151]